MGKCRPKDARPQSRLKPVSWHQITFVGKEVLTDYSLLTAPVLQWVVPIHTLEELGE